MAAAAAATAFMINPLTFNAAYFHLRASNVLEFESNSLESQLKFTLCFSTLFFQLKPAKFSRVNFFNLTFVKQTNKQTGEHESTRDGFPVVRCSSQLPVDEHQQEVCEPSGQLLRATSLASVRFEAASWRSELQWILLTSEFVT